MNTLAHKIQKTALFSLEEKVDILAALHTFSAHDTQELESIIDEYDGKYQQILQTFRKNMSDELDAIYSKTLSNNKNSMKRVVDEIKVGISAVTNSLPQ